MTTKLAMFDSPVTSRKNFVLMWERQPGSFHSVHSACHAHMHSKRYQMDHIRSSLYFCGTLPTVVECILLKNASLLSRVLQVSWAETLTTILWSWRKLARIPSS